MSERQLDTIAGFLPRLKALKCVRQRLRAFSVTEYREQGLADAGGGINAQHIVHLRRTVGDAQLLVKLDHGERAVVHMRRQSLIGDPQSLDGHLQLMHAQRRRHGTDDIALIVPPRHDGNSVPDTGAAGDGPQAVVGHGFAIERATDVRHELAGMCLVVELEQRLADHLGRSHVE